MNDETVDGRLIAEPIKGGVVINYLYEYAGVGYAEVEVSGWDDVKRLVKAIDIRGRVYGFSGWNSDRMVAYYRTDKVIGRPVKGGL